MDNPDQNPFENPPDGFERAFGKNWQSRNNPQQANQMAQNRWAWILPMIASPTPSWERDIPFWVIPENGRELFCDLWRPKGANISGLALIYFHGSARINAVFPWTNHAFDLLSPRLNPAAQSSLYDVDRFLALLTAEP